MLQRYSVRLRIHSWFMKYCHPKLASTGVIAGDIGRRQHLIPWRRMCVSNETIVYFVWCLVHHNYTDFVVCWVIYLLLSKSVGMRVLCSPISLFWKLVTAADIGSGRYCEWIGSFRMSWLHHNMIMLAQGVGMTSWGMPMASELIRRKTRISQE